MTLSINSGFETGHPRLQLLSLIVSSHYMTKKEAPELTIVRRFSFSSNQANSIKIRIAFEQLFKVIIGYGEGISEVFHSQFFQGAVGSQLGQSQIDRFNQVTALWIDEAKRIAG